MFMESYRHEVTKWKQEKETPQASVCESLPQSQTEAEILEWSTEGYLSDSDCDSADMPENKDEENVSDTSPLFCHCMRLLSAC